jgi:hypothetical protein
MIPESPEWQSVPRGSRGKVMSPGEEPGIAFRIAALTASIAWYLRGPEVS